MIRLRWKWELFLSAIPVLGFAVLFYLRHYYLTQFECLQEACLSEDVLWLDRWVLESVGNLWSQRWSNLTQNFSAIFALTFLMLFHFDLKHRLREWWVDLLLLFQAIFWNLFLNEFIRTIFQRARPYVYHDQSLAVDPSAYTSFYSGHTSFAAIMCTMTFLILLMRGARKSYLSLSAVIGSALVIATAILRVHGGQHFLTDVIFGAIAGTAIAIGIAIVHFPSSNRASFSLPSHVG